MSDSPNKAIKASQELEEREAKKAILSYHLSRADFLLKILESSLMEFPEVDITPRGIVPLLRVHKLTPEQANQKRMELRKFKAELLEKIGIVVP